jgi:hypothetical protein
LAATIQEFPRGRQRALALLSGNPDRSFEFNPML